jgi:hypothetical protein
MCFALMWIFSVGQRICKRPPSGGLLFTCGALYGEVNVGAFKDWAESGGAIVIPKWREVR